MKRYLDQQAFERISHDFLFLFKAIRKSCGELDFRLRIGYFNIYYKGNSLAKVTIRKDEYLVSIHRKFATDKVFRGDDRFKGLTFVLTGTLHSYTREEASELIRKQGGKVISSVSGNVNYILAGEKAGSKLDKARMLNIPIIDEETFKRMITDYDR